MIERAIHRAKDTRKLLKHFFAIFTVTEVTLGSTKTVNSDLTDPSIKPGERKGNLLSEEEDGLAVAIAKKKLSAIGEGRETAATHAATSYRDTAATSHSF